MHRLALAIGCTISELSRRMSLRELVEWIAYYEIEPWGSKLDGLRMAVNTSAVYNSGLMVANPKKLKSSPCKPEQFFVGIEKSNKRVMSSIEIMRRLPRLFHHHLKDMKW